MISAKLLTIHALAFNRSMHCNGSVAIQVFQAVILGEDDCFCVVILNDEDISQELCPEYTPMRQVNGMHKYNAMIVYDRLEQLVSTHCLLSLISL